MTRSVQSALSQGLETLRKAGIDDAMRDARLLMAHALGVPMSRLTLHMPDDLPEADATSKRFEDLIAARANRVPVSHLLGRRAFYGRDFIVTKDVLDPRPDTETLIDAALSKRFEHVLDLGTGSGCILLTLLAEHPEATGMGTDLSDAALAVARQNAEALDVAGRADLRRSDWFDGVTGQFDLIVSNPPYIAEAEMPDLAPELAHEPRMALTDGADGLSAYRILATQAPRFLTPHGRLLLEIGRTQGADVAQMLGQAGFCDVAILRDLNGLERVVTGVFAPQTP